MRGLLLFAVLHFCWDGSAEPSLSGPKARRIEVLSRQNYWESLDKGLKPNRLYGVRDPKSGNWVFVLSDKQGALPRPLEALAPGSVLAAENIGGEAGKKYLLGLDSKWTPTQAPLERRVWILSRSPDLRIKIPGAPPRKTASLSAEPSRPAPKSLFTK